MKGKTTPEERTLAFAFLRERYPNAFRLPGDIKPLEIGIKGKLIAEVKDQLPEGVSLRAIYVALHYYCCSKEYKKVRKILESPRIDLSGQIVGQVTSSEIELGHELNTKRRQVKLNKKAQQQALEVKRREKQTQQFEKVASKKVVVKEGKKPASSHKKGGNKGNKLFRQGSSDRDRDRDHYIKPTTMNQKSGKQPTIIVRKRKLVNLPGKGTKNDKE